MSQITIDQALEMAVEHHRSGRLADAEGMYRQILAQKPEHAPTLHFLGVLAGQAGQPDAAIELIKRAITINPHDPVYHNNLANNFLNKGQLADAISSYREALRLKPDYAEAINNLGGTFYSNDQMIEAADYYQQAIRIKPDYAEAYHNLATIQHFQGHIDEAIASCRRAITLQPNYLPPYLRLSSALIDEGQINEAITCCRCALALEPQNVQLHSYLLVTLQYHANSTRQSLFNEARQWGNRHAEPLAKSIQPHTNNRDPDRPLRIGYVSADFRRHASASFLMPLFQNHDRSQFHITAYADIKKPDDMTQRLQQHTDTWRTTVGLSDAAVADLIRADQIDILIDLKLHSNLNRLMVFARKPAPIQITWLAYPGTTGMKAMDYRLTDPYLDPPSLSDSDAFYSETSLRLPDTFWCYDPLDVQPEANPLPALQNGHITFGSMNTLSKVSDQALETWAKLLRELPNSRLLFNARPGSRRRHVRQFLTSNGIAPERCTFIDLLLLSRQQYFAEFQKIDLALDPFPYTGVTTTCDALWMGVPVITLAGRTSVGRGGVSILSNVGLKELIAQTEEEYVQLVIKLAQDLPRLTQLRASLRQQMRSSPLMDGECFARDIEKVYRHIWQKWCATQ